MLKADILRYCLIALIISLSVFLHDTISAEHKTSPSRKITPRRDVFIMENRLFDMVNSERRAKGLPLLKSDAKLQKAARAHSRDMIKRKFFDHTNPDKQTVGDRLKIAKIKWTMAAENIASNKNMDDPVESAFEDWLKSSSHYKNIINAGYELSGIGIAQAQDNAFYFTQVFVKP
ncbi:MAG: CAP domain-containing protein [Nitrospirota bacterium]|jgi:uncharacterized protein YkwD